MFFSNLMPLEIPIMENYIRYKVKEIAGVFFKDSEGFIPKM
jgi:hypothetical protein